MLLIPENILNIPIDFISIAFPVEMCKGNTTLGGFGGPENGPASPGWVAAPTFLCLGKEKSPLCGAGMHPPFFFVLPKKNAPCTVEEKGAFASKSCPCGQVWTSTGVGRDSSEETWGLMPGAPYPCGTKRVLPRIWGLGSGFRGGQRCIIVLFSLSLPVLDPGREIQRGGTAVPPL